MNTIEFGDCRDTMRRWAEQGVKAQMCVTSPPYFGLRDYGHEGQIGLEQTPEEYIAAMVEVFRCVRDVLADDGTLWVNIGDSYARTGGTDRKVSETAQVGSTRNTLEQMSDRTSSAAAIGLKSKDLIGVPWMLAFALRADGWYLRQDIIWNKPNPMPESVRDRCTKAHEYLFLMSKSERYFFDSEAMKEKASAPPKRCGKKNDASRNDDATTGTVRGDGETRNRRSVWTVATKPYNGKKALTDYVGDDGKPYTASPDCPIHGHLARRQTSGTHGYGGQQGQSQTGSAGTCESSILTGETSVHLSQDIHSCNVGKSSELASMAYVVEKECTCNEVIIDHFATFPPALIEPCILAGSRPGDIVLDPFMGSGTTAAVAIKHGRQYLGCELNPGYGALQQERIRTLK